MNWENLLSLKKYGDQKKRLRSEENKTRLGFEVDYDRIIFSSAFRSLQDKTQVVPLSNEDFVHTRLTHSLEVSVVGRSLGRIVGEKILQKHPQLETSYGYQFSDFGAIVAAACLAHDIGNPPFGHSGEKAIGEFFLNGKGKRFKEQLTEKEYTDLTKFEGNANGFRLLTENLNSSENGLRITYATLGAFMKYPKESLPHKPTKDINDKKYGFFQSEKNIFKDVAEELGLIKIGDEKDLRYKRHPLSFLVEAADDICYTIIDFEDGINLGLIEEEKALEFLIKLVKEKINTQKYQELKTKAARLSYLRALSINTLIQEASAIFIENEEKILAGKFNTSLLDSSSYKAQIEDIIKISVDNIYFSQEVMQKEITGYQVIHTLLDNFCRIIEKNYSNESLLSIDRLIYKSYIEEKVKFHESFTTYQWLLCVSSYVASLSDSKAIEIYKQLQGV
ncbi:deoxyguanosinetriphosphate triphosphohydrolase [Mesonia sp. K7]|uniref:deoxyguanosinetriphosphate triphosphohydrolase n=1 Tax=Mesonia sp. K7 TaxID=2218606 RepID=UPI000DA7A79E|nr:deoxyguanosinetriphosphate triphosphohydrolase [Mesonia sp. K7]PZD78519.1 deoxyguanosinetriphosphate triphosphohydrolase [Mesonia sp. K7]